MSSDCIYPSYIYTDIYYLGTLKMISESVRIFLQNCVIINLSTNNQLSTNSLLKTYVWGMSSTNGDVWGMFGGCLGDVWGMLGGCLEDVWGCLGVFGGLFGGCLGWIFENISRKIEISKIQNQFFKMPRWSFLALNEMRTTKFNIFDFFKKNYIFNFPYFHRLSHFLLVRVTLAIIFVFV